MAALAQIVLRFLAAILGRWISWGIVRTIIVDFIAKNKAAFLLFVADLVKDVLYWIADNINSEDVKHPKQAVLRFLLERTGLELEGFDKESMKKAAGQLLANKVNEKYGTSFTAFYPPENIIEQIKIQLQTEVIQALADGV
jgi:hypothetical protein